MHVHATQLNIYHIKNYNLRSKLYGWINATIQWNKWCYNQTIGWYNKGSDWVTELNKRNSESIFVNRAKHSHHDREADTHILTQINNK